jgi:predicted RNase H-like nuclease (RuvC/YqgF family)
MTNDGLYEWLTEVEAENKALSRELSTARAEIVELRKKLDELRAEVNLLMQRTAHRALY